MKIGLLADSHDNVSHLHQAVELFNTEGVELVLHAGDFVAPFAIVALQGLRSRVVAVFGNNDGERVGLTNKFTAAGWEVHPNLAQVEIGGRRIGVVHEPELVPALAAGGYYDLVVYGHTHEVEVRRERDTLIVNPGEAGGWLTGRATVALVELETLEVQIRDLSASL
ncbi:MAG TPA: metallophosphoesterase [Piscirickettsiaceae bacterium]|nr:metallophosphoesterase [Piscirickettsiaceae bacterium]